VDGEVYIAGILEDERMRDLLALRHLAEVDCGLIHHDPWGGMAGCDEERQNELVRTPRRIMILGTL
jgi:hypothetical protein